MKLKILSILEVKSRSTRIFAGAQDSYIQQVKKNFHVFSILVNGYKRTMQQIKVSFVSHIKVKHQTKTNCF